MKCGYCGESLSSRHEAVIEGITGSCPSWCDREIIISVPCPRCKRAIVKKGVRWSYFSPQEWGLEAPYMEKEFTETAGCFSDKKVLMEEGTVRLSLQSEDGGVEIYVDIGADAEKFRDVPTEDAIEYHPLYGDAVEARNALVLLGRQAPSISQILSGLKNDPDAYLMERLVIASLARNRIVFRDGVLYGIIEEGHAITEWGTSYIPVIEVNDDLDKIIDFLNEPPDVSELLDSLARINPRARVSKAGVSFASPGDDDEVIFRTLIESIEKT